MGRVRVRPDRVAAAGGPGPVSEAAQPLQGPGGARGVPVPRRREPWRAARVLGEGDEAQEGGLVAGSQGTQGHGEPAAC